MCYESQRKSPEKLVNVSGPWYNFRMTQNWFKYTYVCSICDALIEITNKTNVYKPHVCCDHEAIWLSVVNATIQPTNERNTMETTDTFGATVTPMVPESYDANVLVTYKDITNGVTTYPTIKVNDLEWKLDNYRRNSDELRKSRGLINGLSEQVSEWADPNYDKEEVLIALCEYFGINPTREVEFTATVEISGTIQVPFNEVEDFDLDDHLSDNLSIDFNHGDSELSDWTINYSQVQ
jgi:hypothetical protein